MKQKLIELEKEIGLAIILVDNFNIFLSVTARTRQGKNQ